MDSTYWRYISELLNYFKLFIYFLFLASALGHTEGVKELLNRGANIEEKDKYGKTPLIWGVFLQFFNQLKWFIYFLFLASALGHTEVVKELLNRGANIEEKDKDGETPLIRGVFLQLFNQLKWFIYFLFLASALGHTEVVKELLNRGASIEEKDKDGWTPLIWGIFLNSSIN